MPKPESLPVEKDAGAPGSHRPKMLRALGLGLITGAADDDPSAIGTYANAGAKFGTGFLWTATFTFPMMFAVVYLSAKLGQVAGQGLFAVLRKHYSRWLVYPALTGILIGNTIEAGADLGGIAAALNLLIPIPVAWIVVMTAAIVLGLQFWGSYVLIRNIFRVLAMALAAYIVAAILARPDWAEVARNTLIPRIRFDKEFLALIVAVIGTTLSAYLYTWQSNEEVEEEIAMGRTTLGRRKGATNEELNQSRNDVLFGMLFSNIVMFFVILAAAATLHRSGHFDVRSAADAAQSLAPIAGGLGKILFVLGIAGVGFLAVPVMTGGAAYDLCQTVGWKYGLNKRPGQAKRFYVIIALLTVIAVGFNFLGINPMQALVWAGVVQGFSTPPLMLLILLMTNNREIMGDRVNSRAMNILGGLTFLVSFAAAAALVITWFQ